MITSSWQLDRNNPFGHSGHEYENPISPEIVEKAYDGKTIWLSILSSYQQTIWM